MCPTSLPSPLQYQDFNPKTSEFFMITHDDHTFSANIEEKSFMLVFSQKHIVVECAPRLFKRDDCSFKVECYTFDDLITKAKKIPELAGIICPNTWLYQF